MIEKASKYSWLVFLLSALFCAYEFLLRVKISPLMHQLLTEFNTSANALGFLSSAFFYGYAPIQLLAGPIIQRYGVRKIMTAALFLCAFSTLSLANADNLSTMFLLRFLAGVGSGFAFIGAYILVANWFPSRLWAFLYGLLQLLSCLGAMYGQQVLAFLAIHMSWRYLSQSLGFIGIGLTIIYYLFIKESPNNKTLQSTQNISMLSQLKQVAFNPKSYPLALYAFFSWGPIAISASLWGPAFLASKLMITPSKAAFLFSYVWLGIALGSPYIGYLSTKVSNQKKLMLFCSGIGLIACYYLLNHHIYALGTYKFILFGLGFATAAQPISFVKIQQANPENCRGTAVGFNNTAVILSGAFLQPLSSHLIEHSYRLNSPSLMAFNYTQGNYLNGLLLMPICFFFGLILTAFFIREKNAPSVKSRFFSVRKL